MKSIVVDRSRTVTVVRIVGGVFFVGVRRVVGIVELL